jgi:hypothetical protein
VVANVDEIVTDSVELVRRVGSDARRVADAVREAARTTETGEMPDVEPSEREADRAALAHVLAWNRVVLHRSAACSRCERTLARGEDAWTGMSDEPGAPRAWLCAGCIDAIGETDEGPEEGG